MRLAGVVVTVASHAVVFRGLVLLPPQNCDNNSSEPQLGRK